MKLGYSTLVVNTLIQKKSENKKRIRAVAQRHTLLKCNCQITATNSPRKKKMSSTEKRILLVTDVYHK